MKPSEPGWSRGGVGMMWRRDQRIIIEHVRNPNSIWKRKYRPDVSHFIRYITALRILVDPDEA